MTSCPLKQRSRTIYNRQLQPLRRTHFAIPPPHCAGSVKIEHLAIWASDLERLRAFYVDCLGCTAGPKYSNPATGFSSYFLEFSSGARLELMTKPGLSAPGQMETQSGYAHFALSLGSEHAVSTVTEQCRHKGVSVISTPRQTGDGYSESAISDPEGNLIEPTV